MQLFGDLNVPSIVRIRQFNWTDHVNAMDSKRNVSQVFYNTHQGGRLRGRPESRCWNRVETDINRCKIKNRKER
jgi:hypothetical protein